MKHLFLLCLLSLSLSSAKQPNILFILADDLGIKDLSAEGSEFYETPNIDRIAEKSVRFTRGYSACQVCSPSRASIMTGKYPPKHGVTDYIGAASGEAWKRPTALLPPEYSRSLSHDEFTLAEALLAAGYQTGFFGKWHLGDQGSMPGDHGFQVNVGGYGKGGPYGKSMGKDGTQRPGSGFFAPFGNPKIPIEPADGTPLPHYLAREAASFIEKNKEQPFLAYLSFYAVHAPIQCSEELWKKYQRKAEKLGLIQEGKERFSFDRRLNVRQVQDFPTYAGLLELMDDGVGIVLDKLSALGLEENTIVIFTSDNGGVSSGDAYATSCLPFRGGKGRQWEGGLRQPFYISRPGVSPGTSDMLASGIDFYPTLLDLCEIPIAPEQNLDGISLKPFLEGAPADRQRPLYWHYPHYGNQGGDPSSIIMQGDWKLIYYHEDQHVELYNLSSDIGESQDLSSSQPDKKAELLTQLQSWLQESGALFGVKKPNFNPENHEKLLQKERTQKKNALEKAHAAYLNPSYKPNPTWWGSTID